MPRTTTSKETINKHSNEQDRIFDQSRKLPMSWMLPESFIQSPLSVCCTQCGQQPRQAAIGGWRSRNATGASHNGQSFLARV